MPKGEIVKAVATLIFYGLMNFCTGLYIIAFIHNEIHGLFWLVALPVTAWLLAHLFAIAFLILYISGIIFKKYVGGH